MLHNNPPAIVLGCHKIGLGIIRALGHRNIDVVGVSYSRMDMGSKSKYLIDHFTCPHPDQAPGEFVSFLRSLANRYAGSVLIPSDDATLIPVSKYKNELRLPFKVVAEDWSVVEKCIVKKNTYTAAVRANVPCPMTIVPKYTEEVEAFALEAGFPCVLKPCVGHAFYERFKKKMLFIRTLDDLMAAYKSLMAEGIEVMIQEYIPGEDFRGANYNSFTEAGRMVIEVTAEKVRSSPPRIGFPRVVVSKRLPELSEPSALLLNELGYHGYSCIEYKKDSRDGIYKLMEINARLNLSTPLSEKAGVNFPYLLYVHALTGKLPEAGSRMEEEVYWIDIGKDILESLRSCRKERYSISEYIKPYLRPHVAAVFARSDISPTIWRWLALIRAGLNRFTRKATKGRVL